MIQHLFVGRLCSSNISSWSWHSILTQITATHKMLHNVVLDPLLISKCSGSIQTCLQRPPPKAFIQGQTDWWPQLISKPTLLKVCDEVRQHKCWESPECHGTRNCEADQMKVTGVPELNNPPHPKRDKKCAALNCALRRSEGNLGKTWCQLWVMPWHLWTKCTITVTNPSIWQPSANQPQAVHFSPQPKVLVALGH